MRSQNSLRTGRQKKELGLNFELDEERNSPRIKMQNSPRTQRHDGLCTTTASTSMTDSRSQFKDSPKGRNRETNEITRPTLQQVRMDSVHLLFFATQGGTHLCS
jgi:hypothetical protein